MNWLDSAGQTVRLERELGRGGEGAVFNVNGRPDFVAKVYHQAPTAARAAKLAAMVKTADDGLSRIAAWPVSLLYRDGARSPAGFVMPRLSESRALHNLYGPRHRKQEFPKATWSFLVHAARNVAAAFYVVHARGHVIGDVNPNVVFAAENGTVRLIDCDSFQIAEGTTRYTCDVGVPIFTAPELQRFGSYKGLVRTANHDNFGLAVLIWHLLMMGRHPYSGVYQGKEDMPLERAIAEFRFAFGRGASLKGMQAPPMTLPTSTLPAPTMLLFERAFTEIGAQARPTAREWFENLELLRKHIRVCSKEPMHTHFAGVPICPWCAAERMASVFYFVSKVAIDTTFDLNKFWARVEGIASPGPAPEPTFPASQVTPRPLPPSVAAAKRNTWIKRAFGVVAMLASLPFGPAAIFAGFVVGCWLLFSRTPQPPEIESRKAAQRAAQGALNQAITRWRGENGSSAFDRKRQELVDLKDQYAKLDSMLVQEKRALHDNRRTHQLHAYLDRFFIDSSDIPGIGDGRKALLASYNIETAADVKQEAVMRIKGFGARLTESLMAWRRTLEAGFVFNPNAGAGQAEVQALAQRFAGLRKQLELRLLSGVEELAQVRGRTKKMRQMLPDYLTKAHLELLQAEADAAVQE